jgi:hypothetical protein
MFFVCAFVVAKNTKYPEAVARKLFAVLGNEWVKGSTYIKPQKRNLHFFETNFWKVLKVLRQIFLLKHFFLCKMPGNNFHSCVAIAAKKRKGHVSITPTKSSFMNYCFPCTQSVNSFVNHVLIIWKKWK